MSTYTASEEALVSLPELMRRLRSVLESTGLVCSPYVIDHSGNTPSHLINETFSLDLQSENTGENRDTTPIRMGHTLAVTMVYKLRPSDQFESQMESLAREEDIMRTVGEQVDTGEIRVTYATTTRALSPAREHLISRLTFRIKHDWYGQPLG